jgi:hypothetical protein
VVLAGQVREHAISADVDVRVGGNNALGHRS